MNWAPTTPEEREEMLAAIGVKSVDELFDVIPEELRLRSWNIPDGLSEMRTRQVLADMAAGNDVDRVCFLGGGYYDHFIPAAVDGLSSRAEFYTAYTPYQPECAQGTLQAIYEYQSAICRLTNMEYANASLYDGATAVFEAATMAVRLRKKPRIVCHPSMAPAHLKVLKTHAANLDVEIVEGEDPEGASCVIAQNPTFHGSLRDYTALAGKCHEAKALLVVSFYPVSLGLVKTPGEMGADIAIAEGQSLGLPLNFGGPYLGILATRKEHIRRMPGRLAAATEDGEGRRGFVLTLQAREQHIRRDKAMSNICSNEALCALRALIHLCLLGTEGLKDVATHCHAKSEYLKGKISGFASILNDAPTFNEFAVQLPRDAEEVVAEMKERGYCAGLPLAAVGAGASTDLLVAVTEKRTREELDAFAQTLEDVACS